MSGTRVTPAAGGSQRDTAGAANSAAHPPLVRSGHPGHRRFHPARPGAPAVPAQPPRLPARRDPVRRRAVLRQRAAAGARRPAVPGLHHRAAAGHHPADDPGRAAGPGHRDGLGHGRGPPPDRRGQLGGHPHRRPAGPAPRPDPGQPGLRHPGHLPGQRGGRAHRAAGTVADPVLPDRRAGAAGPGPVRGQRPPAGLGRGGVRLRRGGRGVGHPPGAGGGDPAG